MEERNEEAIRIQILNELGIMDSAAEKAFDDIARLSAQICSAPVAFISLLDAERQWMKAKFGMEITSTSVEVSICRHTIKKGKPLIIEDSTTEPWLSDYPYRSVIRFYAGVPIFFEGIAIGTLCVLDGKPRKIRRDQIDALQCLSEQITALLILRKQNRNLERTQSEAEEKNEKLTQANFELYRIAQELIVSEEEVRASFDEINQLKTRIEQREKQYREIVENVTDLIYELNEKGEFTFANPAMLAKSGYTQDEIIGKIYWDLVHEDDRDGVIQFYKNQLKRGEPSSYLEFRMKSKNGREVWMGQNVRMFFTQEKWVGRVIAISRDISDHKQFEKYLQEAKNKAEEATESKSRFLSVMSHEIRTPMHAVLGIAALLKENHPRHDQIELLDSLQFSGENLLNIINEILDFTKLEAHKTVLESVEVNLHSLLNQITSSLKPRAAEKGIELVLSIDKDTPLIVMTDPVRLTQIITNLAGNALKFTESGTVQISMRSKGVRDGKDLIDFEVRDSGIGIAPENIEKIFEQFSQADMDISRRFGGTGLGLSIVKNLLELMGSRIRVESTPGKGSVFSFTLVVKKVSSAKQSGVMKSATRPDVISKGVRILLVEDNRVNQMVATQFIRKWGIEVDIANDGREAIDKVKQGGYDLVLMDLEMPKMNGYEASAEIRKLSDQYFQSLPVLALTATATSGMKEKVAGFGMNDYVAKPFSPSDLHSKILEYTAAHRRAIRARSTNASSGIS